MIRPAAPIVVALAAAACGGPPPSRFPTADDALARMHATYACSRGVAGEAKIDYFDEHGRVRGDVMYMAALPEQVRFDVFSPFGANVLSLTSDGQTFALADLVHKQFLHGPANGCNVARFTRIPVPPFALVQLMRGEAPVLSHAPGKATIAWQGGHYLLTIPGAHEALEEIQLVPSPSDWDRPWAEQRVRVLEVKVVQRDYEFYHAYLDAHAVAKTSAPLVDPDGLDPPLPPSGPACDAEIPRAMRVEVPAVDQDVVFKTKEVSHNPPLSPGSFQQPAPGGVSVRYAACSD